MDLDSDIIETNDGVLFPVYVHEAEHGRRNGLGLLVVTMLVGTPDVGYIEWVNVRNLN